MTTKKSFVSLLVMGFLILALCGTSSAMQCDVVEKKVVSFHGKFEISLKPPSIEEGLSSSLDINNGENKSDFKWLIKIF